MKKKKSISCTKIHFLAIQATVLMLLLGLTRADPRAHTINYTCSATPEYNRSVYVPNFVSAMENISEQVQTRGYGIAVKGSGPDTSYCFSQCYGDLSLVDCVLCYAEARTILPQCYPDTGGRIFLDGCFMRADNYSFFKEYTSRFDKVVCGNKTRQGFGFRTAVKEALLRAKQGAVVAEDMYAKAEVKVEGTDHRGSVYVLANCWTTLNANMCRTCLEKAYGSMLGCLPMSEARALNVGCFMRYSDVDFLNKKPKNGLSRGIIVVIVVSVVSSLIVLVVGITLGAYIWKYLYIQKKRRGTDDARKLAKTLNDSSLNFKYSVLEKATANFDEVNKLGQGGFGTVYKVWKHFLSGSVEELYDPNLMLQNYLQNKHAIKDDVFRVVQVGLLCTQENPSLRPTMIKVIELLTKKAEPLPTPTNPPFIDENTMEVDTCEEVSYPLNSGNSGSLAGLTQSSFYPR
ncbi:hypothetical protein ACFE04_024664 [Oxalis oulophora]